MARPRSIAQGSHSLWYLGTGGLGVPYCWPLADVVALANCEVPGQGIAGASVRFDPAPKV